MARPRVPRVRGTTVALAGFALLRGLLYALIVPPWQAPDEPQHLQHALLMLESPGQITREEAYGSQDLIEGVHRSLVTQQFWFFRAHDIPPSEPQYVAAFSHPPLYYVLAALVIAPLRGADLCVQLYAVRILSVFLTTVAVLVTLCIGRRIFPDKPEVTYAATAVALLLPMHTFVGASVNNDVLAELIGSLIVFLSVDLTVRGPSLRRLLTLALVNALALLTKRTLFFAMVLSIIVCGWVLFRWMRGLDRRQILSGLLLLLTFFAIAHDTGIGLLRLINGEMQKPFSFHAWMVAREGPYRVFLPYAVDEQLPPPTLAERAVFWVTRQMDRWTAPVRPGLTVSRRSLSVWDMVAYLGITFAGFWGNFGWLNVPLSVRWYLLLLLATAASLAGLVRLGVLLACGRVRWDRERRKGLAVVVGAAALCSVQLLGTMIARGQPQQGRYLFPALPAFAILLVLGWLYVVPSRWRKEVSWLISIGLALLDTVVLVYTIIPFYYG
ncbi:MAG TPA: DUF2142 domain-containing protein [Anaerolineae bacterium]|nr:DUF2142 domain-containing protein [Anaerolineae bacterium]